MSTFELEVWNDETEKVTFYSPRWSDSDHNEMDKFLLRMERLPEMRSYVQELLELIIEIIGNSHGANEAFFNRVENWAVALPPKGQIKIGELEVGYPGFPLRLYCLALNEEAVILFNGGIKDAQTVQQSSDSISTKFYDANEFAKRILGAIRTREIMVQGRSITDFNGNTEIIL